MLFGVGDDRRGWAGSIEAGSGRDSDLDLQRDND